MEIKKLKVLIVEENPEDARLLKKMLAEAKWVSVEADHADRVAAAVEKLGRGHFGLVLTSLHLPDGEGTAVLGPLSKVAQKIPVIILLKNNEESAAWEALKDGAQGCLLKSELKASVLEHAILAAVKLKSAEAELKRVKHELDLHLWSIKKTDEAVKVLYKELEAKNKDLQKLDEIKSDFVTIVSHELRTPLSAVNESIGIVLDGVTGELNDEQKDFLETAKRNIDRLNRLINDILVFQKLESGKYEFVMEERDFNATVREVHKTMESLAKKNGLEIILRLDETLPPMRFDKDKVTQVLANLVNNAIKFTPKGSITITTSQRGNIMQLSVKDTGPGIRADDIRRLFQKFQQLAGLAERKTGGTGLGLAISKQIIERHQGKIWAESEFGKGTTFHFILPVKERRTGYHEP